MKTLGAYSILTFLCDLIVWRSGPGRTEAHCDRTEDCCPVKEEGIADLMPFVLSNSGFD